MTNTPSPPRSANEVKDSRVLDIGMRVGLVAYGAMHLLFAFIALQLAWTSDSTSSQGAITQLADSTAGAIALWVAALGLVLLAVWQGAEAVAGYSYAEGATRTRKRISSGIRTIVYLVLAWLAGSSAAGISGGGGGGKGYTAQLMSAPAGQFLVGGIGVAVIGYGCRQVYKGVTETFTDDLEPEATSGSSGTGLVRMGQAGFIAKGVSLGLVGGLFVWAAATYDPAKAGGLDEGLRILLEQPYGKYLLSLMGLGLAAFGAYCFGWARYART